MKKFFALLFVCIFMVSFVGCDKVDTSSADDTTSLNGIDDRDVHDEFLPLGSVVELEGGNRRLLICSRIQTMAGSDIIYDYCACYYPEGITSSSSMIFFNREDIAEVYFIGYEDQEELEYQEMLNELEKSELIVQGDKIISAAPNN